MRSLPARSVVTPAGISALLPVSMQGDALPRRSVPLANPGSAPKLPLPSAGAEGKPCPSTLLFRIVLGADGNGLPVTGFVCVSERIAPPNSQGLFHRMVFFRVIEP